MDKQDAIKMGKRMAFVALNAGAEMGTVELTIAAYRENLSDTLNDEGNAEWVNIARDAFDAAIEAI